MDSVKQVHKNLTAGKIDAESKEAYRKLFDNLFPRLNTL